MIEIEGNYARKIRIHKPERSPTKKEVDQFYKSLAQLYIESEQRKIKEAKENQKNNK